MALRCWLLVWHRHREPWGWVESHGADLASAGDRMSNLSGKPTFTPLSTQTIATPLETK